MEYYITWLVWLNLLFVAGLILTNWAGRLRVTILTLVTMIVINLNMGAILAGCIVAILQVAVLYTMVPAWRRMPRPIYWAACLSANIGFVLYWILTATTKILRQRRETA